MLSSLLQQYITTEAPPIDVPDLEGCETNTFINIENSTNISSISLVRESRQSITVFNLTGVQLSRDASTDVLVSELRVAINAMWGQRINAIAKALYLVKKQVNMLEGSGRLITHLYNNLAVKGMLDVSQNI